MSSYTELLGYSKQLERRLAALERQEAGGAFYTRSEADAKFLTIVDAAATYLDNGAYADFLLATGQASGALIFPQVFSRGIYSYDGIWGSGDPNGDLILEGTSDATKTSSYVILQPTGGKVGIGTSTPGDKLHVSGGGVAVSGGGILLDNNNWFKVKNTGGTAIEIAGIDASNDVYLGAVGNAGGKVIVREDGSDVITITGANVGIGTSPSVKLHVAGAITSTTGGITASSGNITASSGNITANGNIVASGGGATVIAYDRIDGGGHAFGLYTQNNIGRIYSWGKPGDVMAFDEAGKVGIGTSAPGDTLHVLSAIAWQGFTLENRNSDSTSSLFSALKNRNGSAPNAGDYVGGFEGRIGTTGSNVALGSMNFYAEATTAGGEKGRIIFAVRDGATWRGETLIINSSGNVGIGTSTTPERLTVTGNGKFGDYAIIGTSVSAGYYQDAANGAYRAITTTGTGGYYFQSNSGGATTMYVGLYGTYAGYVGIGTSSPGAKLHVQDGDVLLSNNRWCYERNSGGTAIRLIGIDTGNNVYMGAIDNAGGKVIIREDGADVITLHTGNVGIGTTNPQNFKLQVEGRVGVKTGVNAASAMMWVYQDDNGATIPVLRLTQSDLSEEFIYFNATVGTNYPIDTAALGTYYGKVRVSVNGTFKYMPLYNS